MPGTNPQVITLASALRVITDPVFIDGWSQPGWVTTPVIEINGANIPHNTGVDIEANNCLVHGIAINNFQGGLNTALSGNGIFIFNITAGPWIYGCNPGVDASGLILRPNKFGLLNLTWVNKTCIETNGDSINDDLERNIISADSNTDIYIEGYSTIVAGNYIGVRSDGSTVPGTIGNGIYIRSTGNTIRGTKTVQHNIISGNLLIKYGAQQISLINWTRFRGGHLYSPGFTGPG